MNTAESTLTSIFTTFVSSEQRRRDDHPAWDGAVAWQMPTSDGITVRGWAHLPSDSRGTLLLLHPFTCHSMSPWIVDLAAHCRETFQLSTVGVDFRFHGQSDDRFPTFGSAELWDIQAALSWAEAHHFPQPFVLWGESLGGMAAARAAISDARIRAAFLKSPPAWPARVLADIFRLVNANNYEALNTVYGWDIVGDGDIRRHPPDPAHRPLVCYAMGEYDHHDIQCTREVYRHWYHEQHDQAGSFEAWPGDDPQHGKWFVTIPGAPHEFDGQGFPVLNQLFDRFLGHVLSQ